MLEARERKRRRITQRRKDAKCKERQERKGEKLFLQLRPFRRDFTWARAQRKEDTSI